LNSLYYLSHENILNLDHSSEAVSAPYEKKLKDGASKRVQVLVAKYASPEHARKALDDFHSAYLTEHPEGFDPGTTKKQINFFKIEDGWLGYSLDGIYLSVVFECPNRVTAELIINNIHSRS
jgi:hypothetical protein